VRARIVDAWCRYWFPEAPLVDLAAMRIVTALVVLALTATWPSGVTHYFAAALVPPALWAPVPLVAAIFPAPPSFAAVIWLGRLTLAATLALLLGVATRAALALLVPLLLVQEAWLNSAGKQSHGAIALVYAVLFLALSPCDRALSLGRAVRRALRRGAAPAAPGEPRTSRLARWPIDLLFFQISTLYFLAGVAKLRASGLAWADGSTLQYYILTSGSAAGAAVASLPWLCAWLSGVSLSFELLAPLGMVRSLRAPILLVGVAFHVGTGLLMRIDFWPLVSLYGVFVPWRRLTERLTRRRRSPIAAARF